MANDTKNSIRATIPFSFKGKIYEPSVVIDLDDYAESGKTLDSIHHLVATENDIDNYSYEYEVVESSPVLFSEPNGMAARFLVDNSFDYDAFSKAYQDKKMAEKLNKIAQEVLAIDDLESNQDLYQALLQAYELGKASRS